MFRFRKSPEHGASPSGGGERREVYSDRDQALIEVVHTYDVNLSSVTERYSEGIDVLSSRGLITEAKYSSLVDDMERAVLTETTSVGKKVPELIREHAILSIEELSADDKELLARAVQLAQQAGTTDDYHVKMAIYELSTPAAQAAAEAALDDFRFAQLKLLAQQAGTTDDYHVKMAIYELSTPAAQAAAEAALMDMLTQRASEQARAKAEDQSRQHNRQTPPDADNKGSQHARHAHESAEPQPMSKIEKATQLLLELSRDNAYAWLQGADPRDVVRVLNTAQALRDKAMSEGKEPPSDAKIYREYRRKSELYHDDPSNTIHRSVLMLDALMRGDLKHGTLPRL